jgi:2-oxoacid:acceptor oxidoreductase delta subunit (pyruvate/2-ketoisovalerate family)
MLNTGCKRESTSRTVRKGGDRIDLEHHVPLLSPQEAEYEASRCLGAMSCEACDVCRMMCPDMAITRDTNTGHIIIDLDYCKGCGICEAFCPKNAIRMKLEK